MPPTTRPKGPAPIDPERERTIRIQRVAVITFAVVEAVVIAWVLFR